jgi:hypothetical protein
MPRTTGKPDLDRFLLHLARTGNFALSAEWTGRAKSGLYKRKARDPHFAARCEAALAEFRSRAEDSAHPEEPLSKVEAASRRIRTTAGTLILSRGNRGRGPVQIRRSPAGRLTRHGLETFLRALAATANIRLAAHSVGVAASSIHWRCHADPAFAREVDAALDITAAQLDAGFIEACEATFDPDGEHLNWLEDGCMQPIWRDGEQGEANPPLPRITVAQAISFLEMHDRRKRRR